MLASVIDQKPQLLHSEIQACVFGGCFPPAAPRQWMRVAGTVRWASSKEMWTHRIATLASGLRDGLAKTSYDFMRDSLGCLLFSSTWDQSALYSDGLPIVFCPLSLFSHIGVFPDNILACLILILHEHTLLKWWSLYRAPLTGMFKKTSEKVLLIILFKKYITYDAFKKD